jgi:hypothetical protein
MEVFSAEKERKLLLFAVRTFVGTKESRSLSLRQKRWIRLC